MTEKEDYKYVTCRSCGKHTLLVRNNKDVVFWNKYCQNVQSRSSVLIK